MPIIFNNVNTPQNNTSTEEKLAQLQKEIEHQGDHLVGFVLVLHPAYDQFHSYPMEVARHLA